MRVCSVDFIPLCVNVKRNPQISPVVQSASHAATYISIRGLVIRFQFEIQSQLTLNNRIRDHRSLVTDLPDLRTREKTEVGGIK